MSQEQAKALVIKLIKSGRLTKENGQLALKIYANAVKQGKKVTIQQVIKAKGLLEAAPEPEPEIVEDETVEVAAEEMEEAEELIEEDEDEEPAPKKKKKGKKKPMAVPAKGKKGKKGKKAPKPVTDEDAPAKKKGGCFKKILITLLILVLLGGGAGAWFWFIKMPQLAADGFTFIAHKVIDVYTLTPDENSGVKTSVERIAEKIAAREFGVMEIANATNQLANGDLPKFLGLVGFERGYIDSSELTDEEKASGRRAFQRIYKALADGKDVTTSGVFNALPMEQFEETKEDGTKVTIYKLKENVTTEDVQKIIAAAQKAADDAELPDEAYELDLVAVVDRFVDIILKN